IRAAEMLVYDVSSDAVRRANVVLRLKIWECLTKALEEAFIPIGDRESQRAPIPNTHQPHGIEAVSGYDIPFGSWDTGEIDGSLIFTAQVEKPNPGIDFVHVRKARPSGRSGRCPTLRGDGSRGHCDLN